MATSLLPDYPITHAGLQPYRHPQLGVTVTGHTVVRYLRFGQRVRLDRLELPPAVYARWVPNVPTHPAHLILSVLDPETYQWRIVREVDWPADPRIAGAGLSQRMTEAQMNARLARVLRGRPHVIELQGLDTDHLRVECDREHPTWPNHGESNGGEANVPFGILDPLQAFGQPLGAPADAPYFPTLQLTAFDPRAPRGMTLRRLPYQLLFASRRLAIGFSLRRPLLLHLGWDDFGHGGARHNRLLASHAGARSSRVGGLSGPTLRTLGLDCQPQHWTGELSVRGNEVAYRGLHSSQPGLEIDAVFTIEPERIVLQLRQRTHQAVHALEAHAWRLVWDGDVGITGAAARPTLRPGRNGDVQLPMWWATDQAGALACRSLARSSPHLRLQIESYRAQRCVTGGFAFGGEIVPAGDPRASLEWRPTHFEPRTTKRPGRALARHWGAIYSCFRPEFGGFSNHALSSNCHVNQHHPAEIVVFTRPPRHGPNPLDLYRFTVQRALLGGGGYGYWRNLYLDSDPVLISAAGRIQQTDPNRAWLRQIEPGLLATVQRITESIGDEGLVLCRALSGNAGSHRWSSNAMDVVGFGHMDAYVNAWTYRALRNATALLADLGHHRPAAACRERAETLQAAFARLLVNPKTGWVAGWRSRDGELHDYAFTWINGVACAFGLLDQPTARQALAGLERLRIKQGAGCAVGSIPLNLVPIRRDDHILPRLTGMFGWFPTTPTFEFYTDGSLAACFAGYYLRALALAGLHRKARRLARELTAGYEAGLWTGGIGSGNEFHSWDGLCTGYEGTFVGNFNALYGIAIEQKLFRPPDPEWWPANG